MNGNPDCLGLLQGTCVVTVETDWSRSGTESMDPSLLRLSSHCQCSGNSLGTRDAELLRHTALVISASTGRVCQEFSSFMSRDYYYLVH